MNINARIKSSDSATAVAAVSSDLFNGVRSKGMWEVQAFSPLQVKDGGKVIAALSNLFGATGKLLNDFHKKLLLEQNKLAMSLHARVTRVLRNKHFFDRFIEGGGELLWADYSHNLVTDVGLTDCLEKYFRGSAYTAGWYVGLMSSSPTIANANTMSSHAWTEIVAYSEATRPAFTPAAAAAKSLNNSASKATFTINANGTSIGGAFVTTGSAKSGTTGILYSATAFAQGDRVLGSGDALFAQSTFSQADDNA